MRSAEPRDQHICPKLTPTIVFQDSSQGHWNFKGRKNNKLNFLWPKMARLGPLFDPKTPRKCLCGSHFLRSFPGNEAHKFFFWGPRMGDFGWGAKSLC